MEFYNAVIEEAKENDIERVYVGFRFASWIAEAAHERSKTRCA